MVIMLLSTFSVILFCLCCYQLIRAVLQPLPVLNLTGYSRSALRVRKSYQVFSWGIMTFAFLFALVLLFTQVYLEL